MAKRKKEKAENLDGINNLSKISKTDLRRVRIKQVKRNLQREFWKDGKGDTVDKSIPSRWVLSNLQSKKLQCY